MSDKHDRLGDRMKNYEISSGSRLINRIPVICRIDGKAFHTFCKRFEKPYDPMLNWSLNQVMLYLCKNIQLLPEALQNAGKYHRKHPLLQKYSAKAQDDRCLKQAGTLLILELRSRLFGVLCPSFSLLNV